jgi:hypothetical protein
MELNRIDLVVLYSLVHAFREKVVEEMAKGKTREDAVRSLGKSFGIVGVWGGKTRVLEDEQGNPVQWRYEGKLRPIPAGSVNRIIITNRLGNPLFHSNQFYRIAESLTRAGWLLGEDARFVPSENADIFVMRELDPRPIDEWPYSVEVVNGKVEDIQSPIVARSVV